MSSEDEELEAGSVDEIDEEECWRLLSTQPVGRIAVIVGHYPVVFPVNFTVAAHGVAFKTNAGTKLWATHRSNVSFEVDEIDTLHKSGWSVLIRGSAREIIPGGANQELVQAVQQGAPESWAPGSREHLVRIVADSISGRRIRPGGLPAATDLGGCPDHRERPERLVV